MLSSEYPGSNKSTVYLVRVHHFYRHLNDTNVIILNKKQEIDSSRNYTEVFVFKHCIRNHANKPDNAELNWEEGFWSIGVNTNEHTPSADILSNEIMLQSLATSNTVTVFLQDEENIYFAILPVSRVLFFGFIKSSKIQYRYICFATTVYDIAARCMISENISQTIDVQYFVSQVRYRWSYRLICRKVTANCQ